MSKLPNVILEKVLLDIFGALKCKDYPKIILL